MNEDQIQNLANHCAAKHAPLGALDIDDYASIATIAILQELDRKPHTVSTDILRKAANRAIAIEIKREYQRIHAQIEHASTEREQAEAVDKDERGIMKQKTDMELVNQYCCILTSLDCAIIRDRYLNGLTYKELAELYGMSQGVVRRRCIRAIEDIRKVVKGE